MCPVRARYNLGQPMRPSEDRKHSAQDASKKQERAEGERITNDARDRSENRNKSSLKSSGQFVRSLSTPPGEPYNDPELRKE